MKKQNQTDSSAKDKGSKSGFRPQLSVNSSLSFLLNSCGVNREEERETDRGGDVYTCKAALVCAAQSGGFQPAALGALTLAQSTLFFSPWDKQVLGVSRQMIY